MTTAILNRPTGHYRHYCWLGGFIQGKIFLLVHATTFCLFSFNTPCIVLQFSPIELKYTTFEQDWELSHLLPNNFPALFEIFRGLNNIRQFQSCSVSVFWSSFDDLRLKGGRFFSSVVALPTVVSADTPMALRFRTTPIPLCSS